MSSRASIRPLYRLPDQPGRVELKCPPKTSADPWALRRPRCQRIHHPDPETAIKNVILDAAAQRGEQAGEEGIAAVDDRSFLSIGEVETRFVKLQRKLAAVDPEGKYGFGEAQDPTALYGRVRSFLAGKVSAEVRDELQTATEALRAWNAQLGDGIELGFPQELERVTALLSELALVDEKAAVEQCVAILAFADQPAVRNELASVLSDLPPEVVVPTFLERLRVASPPKFLSPALKRYLRRPDSLAIREQFPDLRTFFPDEPPAMAAKPPPPSPATLAERKARAEAARQLLAKGEVSNAVAWEYRNMVAELPLDMLVDEEREVRKLFDAKMPAEVRRVAMGHYANLLSWLEGEAFDKAAANFRALFSDADPALRGSAMRWLSYAWREKLGHDEVRTMAEVLRGRFVLEESDYPCDVASAYEYVTTQFDADMAAMEAPRLRALMTHSDEDVVFRAADAYAFLSYHGLSEDEVALGAEAMREVMVSDPYPRWGVMRAYGDLAPKLRRDEAELGIVVMEPLKCEPELGFPPPEGAGKSGISRYRIFNQYQRVRV